MATINKQEYEQAFYNIIQDIQEHPRLKSGMPYTMQKIAEHAHYSAGGGELMDDRPCTIAYCVQAIRGKDTTKEELQMAYKLGWIQNILQSYVFAVDDYLDMDDHRWGKPTWYSKRPSDREYTVDTLLLGEICYDLLFRHFGDKPFLVELYRHFHKSAFGFVLGMHMELSRTLENDPNGTTYDEKNYNTRVWTTNLWVYFSGYFHCALIMTGVDPTKEIRQKCDDFLRKLVKFCTVQDDLRDSFESGLIHAHEDRDIRMGAPKYMLVKFWERASDEQKQILGKHYGKDTNEDAAVVKNMYEEIGLPEAVAKERTELAQELYQEVNRLKKEGFVFADIFLYMVNMFVEQKLF